MSAIKDHSLCSHGSHLLPNTQKSCNFVNGFICAAAQAEQVHVRNFINTINIASSG
jgi:hypothetical protein